MASRAAKRPCSLRGPRERRDRSCRRRDDRGRSQRNPERRGGPAETQRRRLQAVRLSRGIPAWTTACSTARPPARSVPQRPLGRMAVPHRVTRRQSNRAATKAMVACQRGLHGRPARREAPSAPCLSSSCICNSYAKAPFSRPGAKSIRQHMHLQSPNPQPPPRSPRASRSSRSQFTATLPERAGDLKSSSGSVP